MGGAMSGADERREGKVGGFWSAYVSASNSASSAKDATGQSSRAAVMKTAATKALPVFRQFVPKYVPPGSSLSAAGQVSRRPCCPEGNPSHPLASPGMLGSPGSDSYSKPDATQPWGAKPRRRLEASAVELREGSDDMDQAPPALERGP